jgi:hypothetical protein
LATIKRVTISIAQKEATIPMIAMVLSPSKGFSKLIFVALKTIVINDNAIIM